jgi:ribosomal protein S18 acetylase RimI-like enzyme
MALFSMKRNGTASPVAEGRTRLLSIAALPTVRGSGISAKMMAFFEERLKEKQVKNVGLSVNSDNERAIAFYKKTGWQVVDKARRRRSLPSGYEQAWDG